MGMSEGAGRGDLLVADDQAANRELLEDLLTGEGYRVRTAASGEEALQVIAAERPEVVLLDVAMPGLSGLEVCRRLKADPACAAMPVILVTAHADREHRLAGIDAGADEYLTKPVDRAELALRVRNALRLSRLHQEREAEIERLRELDSLRDGLVHMVVHDLRAPLMASLLNIALLREDIVALGDAGAPLTESLDAIEAAANQLKGLVNDILDVHRVEANAMPLRTAPTDMVELAREAVRSVGGVGRARQVAIEAPADGVTASVDAALVRRVLVNLLDNALKFSPGGAGVGIAIGTRDRAVVVRVCDSGPGIAPEDRERVFEKFGQVGKRRPAAHHSTGLGLAFCKLAVELHGGTIGVESEAGRGSTFWFEVPRGGRTSGDGR